MSNDYSLSFISEKDFEEHVKNTLKEYGETLKSINLKKFNNNLIDPIKLLFDKNVYNKSYTEIIKLEIQRQRDKSNTNIIGYFHQNIFKYIPNCVVPKEGWDVIFTGPDKIYYIEMKNKHNTMNSTSARGTYLKMKKHLSDEKNKNKSVYALVEVIAKQSQNIPWIITINKKKQEPDENLRRISIDKFYSIVTGDENAFKNLCEQLPKTIKKILNTEKELAVEKDTVIEELIKDKKTIAIDELPENSPLNISEKKYSSDKVKSNKKKQSDISDDEMLEKLYKLTFSSYDGFDF